MPAGEQAYIALSNVTISANTTSITFSSISQIYRDLVIIVTGSATATSPCLRFNGDSSSNYTFVTMEGNGSSYQTGSTTSSYILSSYYDTLISGGNSITVFNVMDYSATDKHKSTIARTNNAASATAASTGRWANTSAITSVTVLTDNGNFYEPGSTFSLYGVLA